MESYKELTSFLRNKGFDEDICHDTVAIIFMKHNGLNSAKGLSIVIAKRMRMKRVKKLRGIPWPDLHLFPAKPQQSEENRDRVMEAIGELNKGYQNILKQAIDNGGFRGLNLSPADKLRAFRARKALLEVLK